MIVSFKCKDTAALAKGIKVRRFASFEEVARRKLRQLEISLHLDDLRIPRVTIWKRCMEIAPDSTASGSMRGCEYVSSGLTPVLLTSKSWTITKEVRHAETTKASDTR